MLKLLRFILIIVTRLFGHFKQVGCRKVQLLTVVALLFQMHAYAQNDGELLYKSYCMACHTIGSGRLVGPDLIGVNEKYEEGWLISFIQSSQTMVKAGDEKAVKVFNEYMVPMPDQPLNDEQTKVLLNYIQTQSAPNVEEVKLPSEKILSTANAESEFTPMERSLGYLDIVLLSVMGVETITILILINLLFVLIKTVRSLK